MKKTYWSFQADKYGGPPPTKLDDSKPLKLFTSEEELSTHLVTKKIKKATIFTVEVESKGLYVVRNAVIPEKCQEQYDKAIKGLK